MDCGGRKEDDVHKSSDSNLCVDEMFCHTRPVISMWTGRLVEFWISLKITLAKVNETKTEFADVKKVFSDQNGVQKKVKEMSVPNNATGCTQIEDLPDDDITSNEISDDFNEVKPTPDDSKPTVTATGAGFENDSSSLCRTDSSKSVRSAERESLLQQTESEPKVELYDDVEKGLTSCSDDQFEFPEDVTTENGYTKVKATDLIIDNNNKNEHVTVQFGSWTNIGKDSNSGTHHIEFTVTEVSDSEQSQNTPQTRQAKYDVIDENCDLLRVTGLPTTPTDTLTNNSITALLSSKWQDLSRKIRGYGDKTRFRKRIVSKWESLNYDTIENDLYWQEKETPRVKREIAYRWLIAFFTGVCTAVLAAVVHIIVETVSHAKFQFLQKHIDRCAKEDCLWQPALMWIGINVVVSCLGAALIIYFQPMAFGGGVPYIKSYLNGVKIPGLLTLECFIAKVGGVMLSIIGGLACGKEGPMAHAGSIIAAGLGKGRVRLPCGKKRVSLYDGFRDDHEIRDFVSGGAAAGVSAAFGTPVGGTLFSVEEAASFWSNSLTWRVFFSAMIACFFTNLMLSAFHGTPLRLSAPGLVRFDVFPNLQFDLIEIPVFLVMAVVGGLIGAAFVVLNYKLTVFRNRFIKLKWLKLLEAGLVAAVAGAASIIMFINLNSCTDKKPYDKEAIVAQVTCPENQHHSLSTLFLATPEGCLKALLNDPFDSFGPVTLSIFIVVFFFLACMTYGLSVSRGVFIPCLVLGAAWGRLFGMAVVHLFPGDKEHYEKDIGKYALIGAASQLGGVLRATISLSVMIVECTGEVSFGLPIILVLMISKWVGDFISTGLYDMNIEVLGLPLLPWDPPALCDTIKASDLMNAPALTLNKVERVGRIVEILRNETFCGFPVVNSTGNKDRNKPSKVCGLILRFQLLVLLKHKVFGPDTTFQRNTVRLKDFRKYYLQYLKLEHIDISKDEMDYTIDLRPYLTPNPYTIGPTFSLPRLFRLFRGLGLRHLIVVNDNKEPIGMITRKDLAKFRVESKRGLVKVEQLNIEDK